LLFVVEISDRVHSPMAESKRLTRGIQLNQQIYSDFPSFNLFITQEIADNVGSAAKMREERRSEHLQDPIGVQNLPQIQNGNVESSSTRGDLEKDDEERIVVEEDGNEEVFNYFCMFSFLHVELKLLKNNFFQ